MIMKIFKNLVAVLLVVSLLVVGTPVSSLAENFTLYVTKDTAVRSEPSKDSKVLGRVSAGDVIKTAIGKKVNDYGNLWYCIDYDTGYSCTVGWIYSGSVSEHAKHTMVKFKHDGVEYAVCKECGYATATVTRNASITKSEASMVASLSSGAALAVSDGPLPIGDIIAVLIVATATYVELCSPSRSATLEFTEELSEYMDETEQTCSDQSFYWVRRNGGNLEKVDGQCLDMYQAYAYVRAGHDVWTEYQNTAESLASIYGAYYMERDADRPEYWYHYHLGSDVSNKVKSAGHIFFGANDYGMKP